MNFRMICILIISLFVCIFCGCSGSNKDVTESFNLPAELKDYKVIRLDSTLHSLYVLVKANTNENREVIGTSTSGKNPIHTIVIDDIEYVRKDGK